MDKADLQKAYDGSYYTIAGCGGDLNEWVEGYEEWLAEAEIGKPVKWLMSTGAEVNDFRRVMTSTAMLYPPDEFQATVVMLMFPHDGLDVGRLAAFRLQHGDRWFDDLIDNMRVVKVEDV